MNINLVDSRRPHDTYPDRESLPVDREEEGLPLRRSQGLGILYAGDVWYGSKEDGSGDNGPGKGSPANLIDTGNQPVSLSQPFLFVPLQHSQL